VDPGPIPLHCYYRLLFYLFIYILAYYYLLPLDTLNPLFTATREIDNLIVSWGKVLGCVVCRFHVAAGEEATTSTTHQYFFGTIVYSVSKLASINLWKFGFLLLVRKTLVSQLRETCCCAHHTFLLGFPTGCLTCTIKHFSGAIARKKEDFCKGSLSRSIFYFVIVLLYFIFACIVLSKIQKY
jgi:hypothetical protein